MEAEECKYKYKAEAVFIVLLWFVMHWHVVLPSLLIHKPVSACLALHECECVQLHPSIYSTSLSVTTRKE